MIRYRVLVARRPAATLSSSSTGGDRNHRICDPREHIGQMASVRFRPETSGTPAAAAQIVLAISSWMSSARQSGQEVASVSAGKM